MKLDNGDHIFKDFLAIAFWKLPSLIIGQLTHITLSSSTPNSMIYSKRNLSHVLNLYLRNLSCAFYDVLYPR